MDNQGGSSVQNAAKIKDTAGIFLNMDRREVENQVIRQIKMDGIRLHKELISREVERHLEINRRHQRLTKFMQVIVLD